MKAEQRAEGVKRVRFWVPDKPPQLARHAVTCLHLFALQHLVWLNLQAMEEFVADVDHNELRPLQKQGFLCGANCCDTARTQEDLQRW